MDSNLIGEKTDIEKQFNLIAEEYDSNRRKFIPCFDVFYKSTTEFIVSNIEEPKQIVDLGAGTGLLTYFWYQQFPNGGWFINYDQFCAGQPKMNHWFNSYWESWLANSGLTDKDIELWKKRRKLDRECTAEQEVDMLKDCRFKMVKCIYTYQKFSVIVAVK